MGDGLKDALKGCNVQSMYLDNKDLISETSTVTLISDEGDIVKVQLNTPKVELKEGTKYDVGKLSLELLPTQALEEIAKVLDFGQKKYDSWNWAKGFKWSRLIGSAMRHLFAWSRGEDKDPESNLSHLAHLGCCVLFLLQHELSKLGEDDRFKGFKK